MIRLVHSAPLVNLISKAIVTDPEVVNLFIGQLPFAPPRQILDAMVAKLTMPQEQIPLSCHRYADARGVPALRRAIAERYHRLYDMTVDPDTQVLVTHGATEAIWLAIIALTNPGDEIIIPDPCYMAYESMSDSLGRQPVRVATSPERGFCLDYADLQRALTQRTRLLLLNSPENPTGAVYDESTLSNIIALAHEYSFYILHDEVYDAFTYNDRHIPALAVDPQDSQTIMVNSISKRLGMGGWRIGWSIARPEILSRMISIHRCVNMTECTMIQQVISDFINDSRIERQITEQSAIMHERGRRFLREILRLGVFECPIESPRSGFYLFVQVDNLYREIISTNDTVKLNSAGETVADYLLKNCRIAVGPGISFGPSGQGYIRMSFAAPETHLEAALDRLYSVFH